MNPPCRVISITLGWNGSHEVHGATATPAMKTTIQITNIKSKLAVIFGTLTVLGVIELAAAPIPTTFTYQGKLSEGGTPATGIYDLRFALFDAASAGANLGGPIALNDVGVTNGLFTVQLDFGEDA